MAAGHLVLMCFSKEDDAVDYETGIGLMLGKADAQFIISPGVRYKGVFLASKNQFAESKIWNFSHFVKIL
jgi:hypothetical protein